LERQFTFTCSNVKQSSLPVPVITTKDAEYSPGLSDALSIKSTSQDDMAYLLISNHSSFCRTFIYITTNVNTLNKYASRFSRIKIEKNEKRFLKKESYFVLSSIKN